MPLWISITIAAALFQNIRTTMLPAIMSIIRCVKADMIPVRLECHKEPFIMSS